MTDTAGMTSEHLPEGVGPEAFLRDADLVGYYERELAANPGDPAIARRLAKATIAAQVTDLAIDTAESLARADEAQAAAEAEAFEKMTPKEQETEVLRKFRESRKDAP